MNCRWVFWLDPFFLLLVLDNLVLVNHEIAASEHSSRVYGGAPGQGGVGGYAPGSAGGPQHPFAGKKQRGGGGPFGICRFEIRPYLQLLAIT